MFGAVARSLREARDIIAEDLATHTGYSKSMVIKIERGDRMPPPKFVERAEALLQCGDVLRKAAEHLERAEYLAWFEGYVDLERTAVSLYTYETFAVNGLLQTEDYARALLSARCPVLDAEEIDRRLEVRMARQELLTRVPLAQLSFLMDESVLKRPVGGEAVQKVQLAYMLEIAQLRNVTVQVLPMTYGAHAGYNGSMTLLETPERQLLAYLEVQGRSFLVEDRDEVSTLNQRYAMIRSQALSVRESAKVIEQIAGEL